MKSLLSSACVLIAISLTCRAQGSQPPVTQAQLQYFRYMLMNLGSVDHSQDSISSFEASLVPAFGLNSQEAATIHSAGQTLNVLLVQIRQSSQAITSGKAALSASDLSALSALAAQREAEIVTLANQIVNAVRPQTAAQLEMAGTIVANALTAAQGGK
jgi:hypothetical protein